MTEEHYQDGLKLPTNNLSEIPWELMSNFGGNLYRMKIDGGYLYLKCSLNAYDSSMCFVPEDTMQIFAHHIKEAYNNGYENGKQDSLREFEKEKVEPIAKDLKGEIAMRQDLRDYCFDTLGDNIRILEDRLIAQKADHEITKSSLANIYEKIHKLEEHHVRQIDENRKASKRMDIMGETIGAIDLNNDEELEKLEKFTINQAEHNNRLYNRMLSNEVDWAQLKPRIEKLESISHQHDDIGQVVDHPRNEVKLCPHGLPLVINAKGSGCTACY